MRLQSPNQHRADKIQPQRRSGASLPGGPMDGRREVKYTSIPKLTYLSKLATDSRVQDISDERHGPNDDGIWVYLKRGFADMDDDPCQPTHTIHEWSVMDIRRRMLSVKPCQCKDCAPV